MDFIATANYDWMELLNFAERPFRAKFVPSKIWADLDKYKNDPRGLANYCKKWRTKIKWIDDRRSTQMSRIPIAGEYDYDARQCIVEIYTKNFSEHKFTDKLWERFKYRFIQTLMHELIHFMQYDKRGDKIAYRVAPFKRVRSQKKTEERKYLSDLDEIQAYAHCVYLDIKTSRMKNMPLNDFLQQAKTYSPSYTLTYILKTFDYDYRNNHAISKLAWHVQKWDRKYAELIS